MKTFLIAVLCVCCLLPAQKAGAEPAAYEAQLQFLVSRVEQLTQTVQDLKLTVDSQRREIDFLKSAREIPAQAQNTASSPSIMSVPKPSGRFAPEIGAVADTVLKLDSPKTDTGGSDRVSVREIELVLGSNVDPWSRFDATIAFNEDSTAELEEAYLTRFELPFDLMARIGRFKPRIGKVLPVHRDSLDTVDDPLVIQRYFGPEGMNKSGVDVTKLLDIPSPMVHQVTFGVLEGGNGEGGTAFGSTKRRPTIYGHLKNYLDITDVTNLELGISDAIGSRDQDARFEVNVLGLDATLIHQLNANQTLKFQGEVFNLDRKESLFQDVDGNLWGVYGLVDFRINSQWAAGFRFDSAELVDNPITNPHKADVGYTGYLTFYQSEFARWRLQLNHIDLAVGDDDNQFLVQGTFAIGEHKHKLQ